MQFVIPWCETLVEWHDDPDGSRLNRACCNPNPPVEEATGQSKGRWMRSGDQRVFCKPGKPAPNDSVPFFEYLASILGFNLALPIARVELQNLPEGTVALSYELPDALSFAHLMSCGFCRPAYAAEALRGVHEIAEVLALDALLGVADRPSNDGNHIFSVSARSWRSIDYAECLRPAFDQPYNPKFREAVLGELPAVRAAVERIQAIEPSSWDALVAGVPSAYASPALREQTRQFLRARQIELGAVIDGWLGLKPI